MDSFKGATTDPFKEHQNKAAPRQWCKGWTPRPVPPGRPQTQQLFVFVRGPTGNLGLGFIGSIGLIGLIGFIGSIGFVGFRGPIGFIGFVGFIGFIGLMRPIGSIRPTRGFRI